MGDNVTRIAQVFFLTSHRLLRLCFPNYTAAGLVEDCPLAVDGPDKIEAQNGKAAISLSLPFELIIFSIRSAADVTGHIWVSLKVCS